MNETGAFNKLLYSDEFLKEQEKLRFGILFACESGSRAWGMHSSDSDYDIRFVYARHSDVYMSILEPKDTITFSLPEHNIDAHGWDARKFYALARKGNAQPYEWMDCPKYWPPEHSTSELYGWYDRTKEFLNENYRPIPVLKHHFHLARQHYTKFVYDQKYVHIKKYLYIYRSLLSAKYIMETNEPPPIRFIDLLYAPECEVPDPISQKLYKMLAKKMDSAELEAVPESIALRYNIKSMLGILEAYAAAMKGSDTMLDVSIYNREYRHAVEVITGAIDWHEMDRNAPSTD